MGGTTKHSILTRPEKALYTRHDFLDHETFVHLVEPKTLHTTSFAFLQAAVGW